MTAHFEHETIDRLISIYRDGLLHNTLPFWQRFSPDREYGGFLTFLGADGSCVSTDKPMWINGRATWLFARLFNEVERRDEWLDLARHGIDFLIRHGFDSDGRMFFLVTRDGRPLRKRRYLFTEAFGVIAFAEYARATGDASSLEKAKSLFQLVLRLHRTPGALEPKTNPHTRPLRSHAMPMILLATAQVMRLADDDPLYDEVINASIQEVLDDFVKPEFSALLELVGHRGDFIDEPDGREVNPGHAIETSWFIMEEARRLVGRRDLIERACEILDWSLQIGWDQQYGGLYSFCDCKGLASTRIEHDMKLWWPHTEAIYATLLAYHLTGKADYLDWYHKLHEWSYARFPDPAYGEWFGYLHRDGTVASTLKGNLWKGPFHLPRMQLNCWKLLERIQNCVTV